MFKENTAYVILALVAIILIGVTIGLQIVILSDQQEVPVASSEEQNLRSESLSGQIQENPGNVQAINSETAAMTVGNSGGSDSQVALAISSPTDTPEVIVLQPTIVPSTATPLPTSTPLPTDTPLPPSPTSTALPASETQAEEASSTDSGTTDESASAPDEDGNDRTSDTGTSDTGASASVNSNESTPIATDTPTVPAPTPTSRADILMGILDRGRDCTTMTQITSQIMEDRLGVTVDFITYTSAIEMFNALAEQTIDITLCYTDPDDRQLMREFLGDIRQVGSQHMIGDGYKLQLWSNDGAKADMRDQAPCVLNFLERIDFSDLSVESGNADEFIQTNGSSIANWLECPYQ